MERENARTTFTESEFQQIESLVRSLENADSVKQKSIRGKIRKIGLYWSEVSNGMDYNVVNLKKLVSNGTIRIIGKPVAVVKKPVEKKVEAVTIPSYIFPTFEAPKKGRSDSDEYYVIGLCNEALGMTAEQQYRFQFLLGDSGTPLPVDAYYKELNLVVEYYERQHTETVKFFDKRQTVSGVSRGEQRKIYDERRRVELPKHGIKLVVLQYSDFGERKKLVRNHDADLEIVRKILKANKIKVSIK